MEVEPEDSERVRRERDLYRRLLELRRKEEIEPFLEEALALIVEVVGAGHGYLELQEERRAPGQPSNGAGPLFWIARGCSDEDVAAIRTSFSRGVIAEALTEGVTIVTPSALVDPRFSKFLSVRLNLIEAVLCAPIGTAPPLGVVYLQGHASPGAFSEEDRLLVEIFADTVAVFADRLLIRRKRREEDDPTLPFRRLLRADGIVGRSQALALLLQRVSAVAPLGEVGVLLTGPTGTGKTRIARLVHDSSPRAAAPFVELNCATLTETLFESEVFGHKRGSFTGAERDKMGLVRAADGGTLFLDEVAEIPLASQGKLLQLLQSKDYKPLGADGLMRADVRIIAATNVDLQEAVKKGTFRGDLYFRLDVMPLAVPSLAERRDDVGDLVRYFCRRTVEAFKLPCIEPSEGALRAAEAAEWPGNIRQLENKVQRAVITAASEGVLRVERRHLFPDDEGPKGPGGNRPAGSAPQGTFQDETRAFQAELVRSALEEAEWNVSKAATRLDLTRAHVYNLIKAFGLGRPRS